MKWKLTGQFLIAVVTIVAIVVVVNTFVLLYMLAQRTTDTGGSNENVARDLAQHMSIQEERVILDDKGLEMLENAKAFVQLLDDDGNVVDAINAPANATTKYTPYDLIDAYKYQDETFTTIYVSKIDDYSYIMGIPDSDEARFITMINGSNLVEYILKLVAIMMIVDVLIAALIGLVFGSIITRPIRALIERIQLLTKDGERLKRPRYLGIYKPVYNNLEIVNEQLLANEQERLKLEKMRTEWVTNVSHDLKTPLATIQGYAEFLQDDSLSAIERRQYAEIIETRSVYIKELLDDLSLTMRLRNQESILQKTQTTVEPFIREIVIDVLNDSDFDGRTIEFDSTVSERFELALDRRLMKRAVLNFIHNAFIHNDVETVVHVTLTDDALIIADNGKGIAADDLAQVFERYYRGSNTENIRGTGLGMAIARDIIEAHQFTVKLTSEVGSGTTVTIHFA